MSDEEPKFFRYTTPKPTWKPSDGIWVSETTLTGQYRKGDKLVKWEPLPGHAPLNEQPLTFEEKAELRELKLRIRRTWVRWRRREERKKRAAVHTVAFAAE